MTEEEVLEPLTLFITSCLEIVRSLVHTFFQSKFKVTPRLDCMTFVDGAIMFCLYKEQLTELRT